MRHTTLLAFAFTLSGVLSACAQTNFTINGTADGIADGTMIYFNRAVDGELQRIDSVRLKHNSFTFKGTAEQEPSVRYMSYKHKKGESWVDFFLEEGTISMHLSPDGNSVTGTPNNDIYQAIREKAFENDLLQDQQYCLLDTGNLSKEQRTAVDVRIKQLRKERSDLYRAAMRDNITNPVGVMIFKLYFKQNTAVVNKQLLEQMPEKYKQDETIKAITLRVENALKTMIGQRFTDFAMPSPDGSTMSLSDVAGRGKVVLVDFWASWCGPCRAAMPSFIELYNKYKDKGFDVVGVSLDNNKEAWTAAIEKLGLPWKQMSDLKGWNSDAARIYDVRAIPHTMLIDGSGNIVGRNMTAHEIDEQLQKLLK